MNILPSPSPSPHTRSIAFSPPNFRPYSFLSHGLQFLPRILPQPQQHRSWREQFFVFNVILFLIPLLLFIGIIELVARPISIFTPMSSILSPFLCSRFSFFNFNRFLIMIKNSIWLVQILLLLKVLEAENFNSTSTLATYSENSLFESKRIPGCPDLESFQRINTFESLSSGQLNRISCLCGPGHRTIEGDDEGGGKQQKGNGESASITCIYGSTFADLENALNLAKKANKTIERIVLNHVEIGENARSIVGILMDFGLSELRHFEIKKCRGNGLNMSKYEEKTEGKLETIFSALEGIVVEECEIQEMPYSLISRAPNVKSLSLANNKIHGIHFVDLAANKENLENLNLAGNLLTNHGVELGSLSQLKALKNLEIGEHNFASEELLGEIGQLKGLENLDMSQMDGLEDAKQFNGFKNMENLKRLTLTGCNLKSLNVSAFAMFPALEWLDLRVNLIEKLEKGCFAGLNNLLSLSLAGNFLRELPDNLWKDLPLLENLDLGWNDFRKLDGNSFRGISDKLERLNLRNNDALREIMPGTFDALNGLRFLNLSTTMLGKINNGMFGNLSKLKELDLSTSNISLIESKAFEGQNSSLELLNIAGNNLIELEANLLVGMHSLKLLDLSDNRWICDEKMQKIAVWIDEAYKKATLEKKDFVLRHGLGTICDRPCARRGESILDLIGTDPRELVYDERVDTTTMLSLKEATTVDELGVEGGLIENATIDWKAITLLVGSANNEHINFSALLEENGREDAKKPKYDINVVKYGQKSVIKKEANTWLSGVIVTLLVIVTAFCIIIVARRNKITEENVNDVRGERDENIGKEEQKNDEALRRRNELGKIHEQKQQIEIDSQQQKSIRLPKTDTDLEQNCATTTF